MSEETPEYSAQDGQPHQLQLALTWRGAMPTVEASYESEAYADRRLSITIRRPEPKKTAAITWNLTIGPAEG